MSEWLGNRLGRSVQIPPTPQRGPKKDLLEMAARNTDEALANAKLEDAASLQQDPVLVLSELQDILNLPEYPTRIECYDISHVQGSQTVASMVVFMDAKPDKSLYRKFKIQCAEGKPDDFASMREVVTRRFAHREEDAWEPADLMIIDGGKGQLHAAVAALEDLGVSDQPIVSLAKKFEEVFVPGESRPVVIARDSKVLFLLQQIRDEAHRFAITYHRHLRGKAATQSGLMTVKGLGEANKRKLLAQYGSPEAIGRLAAGEIAGALGIGLKHAERFLKQLKQQDSTAPI